MSTNDNHSASPRRNSVPVVSIGPDESQSGRRHSYSNAAGRGRQQRPLSVSAVSSRGRRQGIFWLLTISDASGYSAPDALPDGLSWIRGQQERGQSDGFIHWQVIIAMATKASLAVVGRLFPGAHAELSKSAAANDYVWKEDTRIAGTQFEFGVKPICRNSKPDWESVWIAAKAGDLMAIPASIRVVSYR